MKPMTTACRAIACGMVLAAAAVPGVSARTINFSGYTWDVKNGSGMGPGPNHWSDSTSSVWIDTADDLHLKLRKQGSTWYAAQVTNQTALGYGTYEFRIQTNPESFDRNVVVGLYIYENDSQEIDIEFARWGNPNNANESQYVVQPGSLPGNKHAFNMSLGGNYSTHIFEWTPDAITFTSIHGHYASSPPGSLIQTWTYTGGSIPTPSGETVRMNLWLHGGAAPTNDQNHEFVIDSFTFTPYGFGAPNTPEPAAGGLMATLAPLLLRRRHCGAHA